MYSLVPWETSLMLLLSNRCVLSSPRESRCGFGDCCCTSHPWATQCQVPGDSLGHHSSGWQSMHCLLIPSWSLGFSTLVLDHVCPGANPKGLHGGPAHSPPLGRAVMAQWEKVEQHVSALATWSAACCQYRHYPVFGLPRAKRKVRLACRVLKG